MTDPFFLQKENIFTLPITHYNGEMAKIARDAFLQLRPDCVVVELAETMQLQLLHAASRLPDIGVVIAYSKENEPIYYIAEPCDACFEALRSALEAKIAAFCIDLDIDTYPEIREEILDPSVVSFIGHQAYYEKCALFYKQKNQLDIDKKREEHMAKRLKELSLSYDRILFVCGLAHAENIVAMISQSSFTIYSAPERNVVDLCTLTELSCQELLTEYGWMSFLYEEARENRESKVDKFKAIYQLFKKSSLKYMEKTGHVFTNTHMRNLMKFACNLARITHRLVPDLIQILHSAKACVDHNFAYEVWLLATMYPYRRNVDALLELDLSSEDLWKKSKMIRFHLKAKNKHKTSSFQRKNKHAKMVFSAPSPLTICSYPPEDLIIEKFGEFLKKKGMQILLDESSKTIPFSTNLEDGVDIRETIRHWHNKTLYVKIKGKPPGTVGSVVIIFDEDMPSNCDSNIEKYSWRTTWLGEHEQESDMAFYATPITNQVIGPGISRCEYGGFMMSYPPRRMQDVWSDPEYDECKTKAEILLLAAIDYAIRPLIVFVAAKPPRNIFKSLASRFDKKLLYIPIGQLSQSTLNKLRIFHVLDGQHKRKIAGEYID